MDKARWDFKINVDLVERSITSSFDEEFEIVVTYSVQVSVVFYKEDKLGFCHDCRA